MSMSARLIAIGGPLIGTTLPLVGPEVSVGRDGTNTIALPDPRVSPRHCVFACAGGGVTMRDLDRANPSFVNGVPVGNQSLADGVQIQIGESLLVLSLVDAPDIAAAPSVTVNERPPLAPSTIVMHRE